VSVFVDTSALYAVLDRDDAQHAAAAEVWRRLVDGEDRLVCSNYVLIEACALVQNRLGMKALRALQDGILPWLETYWITTDDHERAMEAVLVADRRALSLVDCTSFIAMRRLGLRRVFAFDDDFTQQGFETLE